MPFRFSLATLLRVRRSLEEREERVLQHIVLELVMNQHRLEANIQEMAAALREREACLENAISARDLRQAYGAIEEVKLRRIALEEREQKLNHLRTEQLKVYQGAHRDRKMLSDLEEQRRELHNANLVRLEQIEIDDRFNARRSRH